MAWTDERIDQLKSMWEDNKTASQIADELGGVSRNAVIGKAHRLGLNARPSPVKAHEEAREQKIPIAPPPEPAAAIPDDPAEPVLEELAPDPAAASETEPAEPSIAVGRTVPQAPQAPQMRSIGPGGFTRQAPGDQQPPIPPAPPRRLVPARPDPAYAGKTSLLELSERICKWPMGHPGEPDFHFCGQPVNPGFPYCVAHCGHAYQAQMPRKDRRPPPPLPFGGPRVR